MPYILDPATLGGGATFGDLQTEFFARGHDYLNRDDAGRARAKRWLNQAHARVVMEELWPFRTATATGAAPLSITGLGQVLTVKNTDDGDRELYEGSEHELTIYDLGTAGTPIMFYRDSFYVRTFPVGGTLSVRYYREPVDLVNVDETTMVPSRFADLIIDDAVRRAAKDRQYGEGVQLAAAEYQDGLALMRRDLLVAPTHFIMLPDGSTDG